MMASSSPTMASPQQADSHASIELTNFDSHNASKHNVNQSSPRTVTDDFETPPETAVEAKRRWNQDTTTALRVLSTFFSFIILGMNDAVYGAIIPSLERYYSLTYTVVSLVFLSPFVGYILAASLNNFIHMRFGLRGLSVLGPACHILAYTIISIHPPYPVLVVAFIFAGFASGIMDAGWNAYLGDMANANQMLGFLHGFYGLGATLAPTIATALIAKAHQEWFNYYRYVMIPAACLELLVCSSTFWRASGRVYREQLHSSGASNGKGALRDALKQRVTWVCSAFLLLYVGIEVALGGWIVVFMTSVRDGGDFSSGMTATGFWLGITVGRFVLGFVTPKIGENTAIAVYMLGALGMELLFWLVPNFLVSAVAVAILGFFLGPLFPAAVVAVSKLLPARLHVSSIGFSAACGGVGASALPFAVGAIAQQAGVTVLQPIIMALIAVALLLWVFGMPSMRAGGSDETKSMVQRLRHLTARVYRRRVVS